MRNWFISSHSRLLSYPLASGRGWNISCIHIISILKYHSQADLKLNSLAGPKEYEDNAKLVHRIQLSWRLSIQSRNSKSASISMLSQWINQGHRLIAAWEEETFVCFCALVEWGKKLEEKPKCFSIWIKLATHIDLRQILSKARRVLIQKIKIRVLGINLLTPKYQGNYIRNEVKLVRSAFGIKRFPAA